MRTVALLQSTLCAVIALIAAYSVFLGLLIIPFFQNQVIYLNSITLTWFQDVNFPEQWGFLHNQVTPFILRTRDHQALHAWHVLLLDVYQQHEQRLIKEPRGLRSDITQSHAFKLLREDPDALLVLYLYGAAGTLGSGWRPPSYRAMYAGAPDKIHTIAIDYRGFGTSTGPPSEEGLLIDATTLAEWAMEVAGIPPSRIVLFGQSLGTAVSISLAHRFATKSTPILFSGMVLVAPMADVETLTATYRIVGLIPILDPVARYPKLLAWLNTFISSKWLSKDKLADIVRHCEQMPGNDLKYHITIIHAEDDYDIPWPHSEVVFWHGVNASTADGIRFDELDKEKKATRTDLGAGGWVVGRETKKGSIRERVLKHGLHDKIMSYPVVSLAILRAFKQERSVLPTI
ncbi:putative Alpha/Beta hydrolase protein [Seiridium cardinale]|uniref:Alpha/Beta hydrolase protein n=1 Tax=Seiridium cardinale TaxID=138064 RepID=A0ABR2X7Q8_9PEZI